MTYEEWLDTVPDLIREDTLWRVEAYRLGLFFGDLSWQDVTKLASDARTLGIADQIYRAVGKISSNVAEGYSRGTGKDRARFYEYALGSAREARDWYYKGRHVLGDVVASHRMDLSTRIARLMVTTTANERATNRRVARNESTG